jgi:hypothetical protein
MNLASSDSLSPWPLPEMLVRKLIARRLAENEVREGELRTGLGLSGPGAEAEDGERGPAASAAHVRLPLRLKGNSFLGGSSLLDMPPFERFPFTVVAYDADGRRVAEKRLESPALRMMNGWDEYTAAYKNWKRSNG